MQANNKPVYIHQRRKLHTNLQVLNQFPPSQLVQIDLSENFIENLSLLRKYEFTNLQVLDLSSNLIFSIEPFARSQFASLLKLYLGGNSITDIAPLSTCLCPKLKELRLGFSNRGNQIEEVVALRQARWGQLQMLTLDSRPIAFGQHSLHQINTSLCILLFKKISDNRIVKFDFQILNHMTSLKALSMKGNHLTSIRFLIKCHLPAIEYINLAENNIVDINGLSNTRFNMLSKFAIHSNEMLTVSEFLKCEWQQVSTILYCNSLIIRRAHIDRQIYQKYLERPHFKQ